MIDDPLVHLFRPGSRFIPAAVLRITGTSLDPNSRFTNVTHRKVRGRLTMTLSNDELHHI